MASLLFALRYFTNLPLPKESSWNEKNAAASLAWLPMTGIALGACTVALELFFRNTGFPRYPSLRALLLSALELWVGGAMFFAGFGKTCDGLFLRLGTVRSFEIMEDGRIGANGALAFLFAALAKVFLLAELSFHADFLYVLLFSPCWARWAVSYTACGYQPAKTEGMAFFFKIDQKPAYVVLSSGFVLCFLLLMPRYFYVAALASFLVLLFCCSLVQSRLGGQTEETWGLSHTAAELSFLLSCAASAAFFQHGLRL